MANDTDGQVPISPTELRTFLIADVRGYTRFTREQGDEAASDLAASFAEIVRGTVPEFAGELLELRGDEALCVFGSARQALRAAVELQRRLRTPSGEDGSVFPVGVGVGLDAGEAVPTEGGYRGGALNLAARLCSVAAPGQVLASETVVHLSQRVDGVQFSAARTRRFKGIEAPVRLVEVISETPLPAVPVVPAPKRRSSTTAWMVAAVALALAAVAAVGAILMRGSDESVGLASNSFSLVEASGHASAPLELDEAPFGVAVDGKVAWLPRYSDDTVLSVDTTTGERQSIQVGDGPDAVAVGAGSVWVANSGDGTVSEVAGGRAVGDPIYVGNGPSGIAVGEGAVWVALSVDGAVAKIDPDTGRVIHTFSVGTNPTRVAVGFGKVWVTNESVATVTPIDPATDTAATPIAVGHGPNGITTGADAVWVTNSLDGTVSRIDPRTLVVVTFPTGGDDPQGVAVVGDAVWVAARRSAEIVRLDAKTGQIRPSLAVGAPPQDLALVGDGAAITTTTSRTEHRGGTLTIAGAGPRSRIAPTVDPDSGYSFSPQLFDKLTTTNDGLVSYKRAPGPDGGTVVADLARTLPTPTDGGRTYTFQLRRGIRYSTGRPVHASDIRYGLERVFSVNAADYLKYRPTPDQDLFGAIVGVPKCITSPKSCDLSRGIVVDDTAGTITFHLRHPDPDLLAKLATPQGVAVPPDVSRDDSGLHPLPATGPYMFSRYTLRRSVLVRNPYFHEWSADAQPDGYPDRIVWRAFTKTSQAVSAVEHGTADWLYFTVPGISTQQIHEIETNYAAQTHPFAYPSTQYIDVAPTSPLARDPRARRAMAYAIDRVKLANLVSISRSLPERSTCRLTPPNFPGYRRDCSYTFEPTRAQQLARRSPSYGKPVSVFSYYNSASGRYVVELLNTLGFRARLLPPDANGDPIRVPDILLTIWAADYVGPTDFILLVHPGLISPSEVTEARAKQIEGQYQGTVAWAAADRHATDTALVVPFGTGSTLGFTSKRVGNYQFAPAPGNAPIIDQMWVR
ncbi:MAG TPA: ABC transporter substrate-binding protein [Gaiellales bacterium]|nr:ABC transporter substrate-binding protein [Gaiellales bacterium]